MAKENPTDISPEDFRIFRTLRRLGPKGLFGGTEFWLAAFLSGGGTVALVQLERDVGVHLALAGDALNVAAGLFGIVLAGFAITAALLTERLSALFRKAKRSPRDALEGFLFTAVLLVTSILVSVAFRSAARALTKEHRLIEEVWLGLCLFVFAWALFSTIQLLKLVFGLAVIGSNVSEGR